MSQFEGMRSDSVPTGLMHWVQAGGSAANWTTLLSSGDAKVRLRVALNPSAPLDVIANLLTDKSWFVRWAASRRPEVALADRELVLAWIAKHRDPWIRMLAASHLQTPLETLQTLALDSDDGVRALVLDNPATTENMRVSASLSGFRQSLELEDPFMTMQVCAAMDRCSTGPARIHSLNAGQEREWLVGQTGPGGGVVFFDAGQPQWWGRYLEVAPSGWAGEGLDEDDPRLVWCPDAPEERFTETEIGWGLHNTWHVIEEVGPASAAWVAASYAGGGKEDWYLPTKDEFDVLCAHRETAQRLTGDYFWTSSQGYEYPDEVWNQNPDDRSQDVSCSHEFDGYVRPVRAF